MNAAGPVKTAVDGYYAKHGVLPSDLVTTFGDHEIPTVENPNWQVALQADGLVVVTFRQREQIAGKTLVLEPSIVDGAIQWNCDGGTLPGTYRPKTEC